MDSKSHLFAPTDWMILTIGPECDISSAEAFLTKVEDRGEGSGPKIKIKRIK